LKKAIADFMALGPRELRAPSGRRERGDAL
jgi:hypothetical protein